MRSIKMYLIPAVMACALAAGAPTGAKADFLFFDTDEAKPVISRDHAQTLARGAVPGTIESTRLIKDGDQTVYVIDANRQDRTHRVTVDGETGEVIADRVGRKSIFPLSLFD